MEPKTSKDFQILLFNEFNSRKLEVVLNNVKSKQDEKEKKSSSSRNHKRLIKDIREVGRHPLNDNGIYIHDELDMQRFIL